MVSEFAALEIAGHPDSDFDGLYKQTGIVEGWTRFQSTTGYLLYWNVLESCWVLSLRLACDTSGLVTLSAALFGEPGSGQEPRQSRRTCPCVRRRPVLVDRPPSRSRSSSPATRAPPGPGVLQVSEIMCNKLAPAAPNRSDPYVKYTLKTGGKEAVTKHQANDLSPVWTDGVLELDLVDEDTTTWRLLIEVFDHGQDDFLGSLEIDLAAEFNQGRLAEPGRDQHPLLLGRSVKARREPCVD